MWDKTLTDKSKILYFTLIQLSYKTGYCNMTDKALAELLGCATDTITRAMKKLTDKGIVESVRDKNRRHAYVISQAKMETVEETEPNDNTPYKEILSYWNENSCAHHKAKLYEADKKALKHLFDEYGIDKIKEAIDNVSKSDFLTGKAETKFIAQFAYFYKEDNFLPILEGNYTNKEDDTIAIPSNREMEEEAKSQTLESMMAQIR